MASEKELRTGMSVSFRYGPDRVSGTIKEDRGPIGVGGRHLYRVEFPIEFSAEVSVIELPANELQVEHHTVR